MLSISPHPLRGCFSFDHDFWQHGSTFHIKSQEVFSQNTQLTKFSAQKKPNAPSGGRGRFSGGTWPGSTTKGPAPVKTSRQKSCSTVCSSSSWMFSPPWPKGGQNDQMSFLLITRNPWIFNGFQPLRTRCHTLKIGWLGLPCGDSTCRTSSDPAVDFVPQFRSRISTSIG